MLDNIETIRNHMKEALNHNEINVGFSNVCIELLTLIDNMLDKNMKKINDINIMLKKKYDNDDVTIYSSSENDMHYDNDSDTDDIIISLSKLNLENNIMSSNNDIKHNNDVVEGVEHNNDAVENMGEGVEHKMVDIEHNNDEVVNDKMVDDMGEVLVNDEVVNNINDTFYKLEDLIDNQNKTPIANVNTLVIKLNTDNIQDIKPDIKSYDDLVVMVPDISVDTNLIHMDFDNMNEYNLYDNALNNTPNENFIHMILPCDISSTINKPLTVLELLKQTNATLLTEPLPELPVKLLTEPLPKPSSKSSSKPSSKPLSDTLSNTLSNTITDTLVKPLAETLTDTIMSEVELLLEDIRIPPTLLDTLQEVTNDIYSELTYVKNKQDTITTEQVTQDTTNLKQETATSTKTVQQDTKKKKPTSCFDALCGLFKKKTGN